MKSPVLYDMFEDAGAKGGGSGLVEEGVSCLSLVKFILPSHG